MAKVPILVSKEVKKQLDAIIKNYQFENYDVCLCYIMLNHYVNKGVE